MQRTFTSREVAAITGISARQLQWWDERGIVVPARAGHKRVYSRDDVAEVAILCELRRRGFSLQKMRRVIQFLQSELGKRLVQTVSSAAEYHLLTDGQHIYLQDSARGVIDLLKNAQQPMLTVCLSDTIARVLCPDTSQERWSRPLQPVASGGREQTLQRKAPNCVSSKDAKKHNGSERHLIHGRRRAS
jgi:DNA-binding transcriptional MerR regulator